MRPPPGSAEPQLGILRRRGLPRLSRAGARRSRTVRLCLALLLLLCLLPLASRGDVSCPAYTAKVDKRGQLSVILPDGGKLHASLVKCWQFYQTPEHVKLPRATASPHSMRFEYLWNGGRVVETLTFTCRSIAIDYEYRGDKAMDVEWFTCVLNFDFSGATSPTLVGGLWRFGERRGVQELPGWATKERFSSLSLRRPWRQQLDILAEGDNWLGAESGYVFVWDKRRWGGPPLPAGEPLHLGALLWFSSSDGKNLPDQRVELK